VECWWWSGVIAASVINDGGGVVYYTIDVQTSNHKLRHVYYLSTAKLLITPYQHKEFIVYILN
jgi:hypothetical protein